VREKERKKRLKFNPHTHFQRWYDWLGFQKNTLKAWQL
jgi:hypothetical protein